MNFMHAALARKLGIDRQEGMALEIILMRVSVAMAALIAGNIDYNFAFESTVNAALQGAPVIGIEVLQDKPPYMVVARPEIHSFADLRGRVVAQNDIFSVAAYVFRQILRANGLKDKDYSMIGAGNDRQRLAALTAGRVQATTFSPPTHLMALKAGMKSLGLAKDYTRAANGVGTTLKKLKDNRDQTKRFLRMLLKTDRWMKSHSKETIDFIMSDYKLDRETAASSYELLIPTLSDNGQIGDDYIQQIIERWRQQRGAPSHVALDRVRDFSIAREAARELGIR
jgi:NitT/TauT family transport system substrate-binding protein